MSDKVYIPPLKIQGIKTKLIPLIKENVAINADTLWIEPFMGSGVVGFNIAPKQAIFSDINPHIINFYQYIKEGKITSHIVRSYLEQEGKKLSELDTAYYYEVRERFNKNSDPLDFLFLNRSCFNGMMRFNKTNDFNVPYGHKPQRFSKAYITKIVNQVAYIEYQIKNNDWKFICQPFEDTINMANEKAFIYCDPPYIGRHVDYYDSWDEDSELLLYKALNESNINFMLSTWDHNSYRKNEYIEKIWASCHKITQNHYYFVGAKETNRNPMVEALLTNYTPFQNSNQISEENEQLTFF